jgi:nucleoid-associated protein YgaU
MEIERQKILRAADQIEFIVDQQNKLIREIDGLKKTVESVSRENARLKEENGQLAKRLDQAEAQRGKEREALLNEVSKLVAESKKSAPQAAPKEPVRAPVKAEEGFEHVVARGDTLWAITEAYRAAGVKVTMEEIRAANGLKEGQALRVGQKLFIPKK